jgi:hypothetical protein
LRSLPGGILPGRGHVFLLLTLLSLLTLFSLFIHEDQEQRKTGGTGGGFDPQKPGFEPGFGRPERAFSEAFLRVQ